MKWKFCLVFCALSLLSLPAFSESETELTLPELDPEAEYIMTGQDIMDLYQKINDLLELRNEFMNWKLEALTFLVSETELTLPELELEVPELEPEAEYITTGQYIMTLYQTINNLYESKNEWRNLAIEALRIAEYASTLVQEYEKREPGTTTE